MRFSDFLRVTVLISAAAASVLGVVSVAGAVSRDHHVLVLLDAGWWTLAAIWGVWSGRRSSASPAIASLLASARTQATLPELNPSRIVLNRLWPLLVSMIGAGALAFLVPQVPGVAAGFAVIWALAWRHQASAVTAVEERDGARFYIEHTSPLRAIKLVRTPGFRTYTLEPSRANGRVPEAPSRS